MADIAWYVVSLSTTDGIANKETLQSALNSNKHVKIQTGSYPLSPQVEIKSATLDLGDSVITSTATKYSGGLFILSGESPTIQNGDISGNFHEKSPAPGDEDFWESESLVSPKVSIYQNAIIDNVRLHNCWGYAVCENGPSDSYKFKDNIWSKSTLIAAPIAIAEGTYETEVNRYGSTTTEDASGATCVSVDINIPNAIAAAKLNGSTAVSGSIPKYIYASNGLGYYRIISDTEILYKFTLLNGSISTAKAVQGICVSVPNGAITVSVTVFYKAGNEAWRPQKGSDGNVSYNGYMLYFTDYAGGLTLKNCKTYYNSSLGMVGAGIGVTLVENCESWGNGKPDENTPSNNTTTGFIDVEDTVSGVVILKNCTSTNEMHFAMLGAATCEITGCQCETDIIIYRGISAKITDTTSKSGIGLFSESVSTKTNIVNCSLVGNANYAKNLPDNVITESCTFTNVPIRNSEVDSRGTYYYTNATRVGNITGVSNVTVYSQYSPGNTIWGGLYGLDVLAPEKGSDVKLYSNEAIAVDNVTAYPIVADANCWIAFSDEAILANGYTIRGCTFTPGQYSHHIIPDSMYGSYENCTFNLDNNAFFRPARHVYNKKISFKNCIIHNSKNWLLGSYGVNGFGDGVEIVFENCSIDDKEKLVASRDNASGVGTAGVPTVTIVNNKPESGEIPLFDRFGNRLNSQRLWIWAHGIIAHPSFLYDRYGNLINLEMQNNIGLLTSDGLILFTSDGLILCEKE